MKSVFTAGFFVIFTLFTNCVHKHTKCDTYGQNTKKVKRQKPQTLSFQKSF
jgi:hypothetical protein